MIDLTGVTYAYPDAAAPVLRALDLHVPAGTLCGVVGASGAGKSTLAKVVSGFVPHAEGGELAGTVRVAGIDVPGTTLAEAVEHVGLVTQNPFNQISGARYTVREEIAFGLENLGIPREEMVDRIGAVADLLGLEAFLDRSPYALSGGQMQLVAIASMLVMRPQVLVMDEPTSQLDPGGTRLVFDVVARLSAAGTTVLLLEHKLEQLRDHADHVVVLHEGRVALAGGPREVLSDERLHTWGVGTTRFTPAARAATQAGVALAGPLPVSFGDAVETFGTRSQA